jgi:RNA-directed DNA polymerase
VPFERYADDVIYHCKTQRQAEWVLEKIQQRLGQCQLELHPEKTKIVYCKDSNRQGRYENISFDYLGFTFKPRKAKSREGKVFTSFLPVVSCKAQTRMNTTLRKWKITRSSACEIQEIAERINPILLGWFNYYGQFGKTMLRLLNEQLNEALVRWARNKYKRFKRSYRRSRAFIKRLRKQTPWLFVHWRVFACG